MARTAAPGVWPSPWPRREPPPSPLLGIGGNADQAFAPYRTTIRGQRIAIIAATDVLDTNLVEAWTATSGQAGVASSLDPTRLVAAVQSARASADTVVVYLHWGSETQDCPNPTQPALATILTRAGADIVVGTHAHVQLGAGYRGRAFVDYGLGNLAFYDNAPPESYSGVLDVTVTGHHVEGVFVEAGHPVRGPPPRPCRGRRPTPPPSGGTVCGPAPTSRGDQATAGR